MVMRMIFERSHGCDANQSSIFRWRTCIYELTRIFKLECLRCLAVCLFDIISNKQRSRSRRMRFNTKRKSDSQVSLMHIRSRRWIAMRAKTSEEVAKKIKVKKIDVKTQWDMLRWQYRSRRLFLRWSKTLIECTRAMCAMAIFVLFSTLSNVDGSKSRMCERWSRTWIE